ncbi:hypothetical protein [Streptomyces sp. NBC_01235]|uniref:hypothetical protein n=1 Tax=Streptomyces sp. NBC_01235 TaxID=2903788 RepID=UPI002E143C14|nr:hypothetical protein OG289_34600 [Streptomyces sp. NBC_01235]
MTVTDTTSGRLPVAEATDVRRAATRLVRADGRAFTGTLTLNPTDACSDTGAEEAVR